MKSYYELSQNELKILASDLIKELKNSVIVLKGDLAAGKTTLVKACAQLLGCKDEVTSPTFLLQHHYDCGIYHYDIYNHGVEHFISLGMLEELEREGLHFVEWGDAMLEEILIDAGISFTTIEIKKISDTSRGYSICTH